MNRSVQLSGLAWACAVLVAGGGLLGRWSITGSAAMRTAILAAEFATLLMLLAASLSVYREVATPSAPALARRLAGWSVASLLLCIGGDVINFNLPQTFHRHGPVVRHDYLADSVWCFAPGYLLLLAAVLQVARHGGVRPRTCWWVIEGAAVAGLLSFAGMHLPGTGTYVTLITGGYSMVITAVGASSLLLILGMGGRQAPALAWAVAVGLVLAAVADAVIGQFWIYGNGGQGWFPMVRDINWVLYVGSQALVIQLPRLVAQSGRGRGVVPPP